MEGILFPSGHTMGLLSLMLDYKAKASLLSPDCFGLLCQLMD